MPSEVSICNSALIKLGETPIVNLTEGTKAANLCQARFGDCRDAVFTMHPWRALRKRATLPSEVASPNHEYKFAHNLPSDCLRLYMVTDQGGSTYRDYALEDGYILSHLSPLYIRYIYRKTNLTDLPQYLAEVVSLYLAADICYGMTQLSHLKDQLSRDFQMAFRQARTIDSQEDAPREIYADDWLSSRFSDESSTYRYRNLI